MCPQCRGGMHPRKAPSVRCDPPGAKYGAGMDNTALVKRRDSKDATGRPPPVPAKAKIAIAIMLEQPKTDLAAAAKAAGVSTYWLRRYLKMPHVARYFRAERQVVLDSICAGNPQALRTIRDEARNQMAAVAAVRGLELMRDGDHETAGGMLQRQSPGVTIVIEAPRGGTPVIIGPQPPLIDARPDEFGPAE
jgi:hypothetical protein